MIKIKFLRQVLNMMNIKKTSTKYWLGFPFGIFLFSSISTFNRGQRLNRCGALPQAGLAIEQRPRNSREKFTWSSQGHILFGKKEMWLAVVRTATFLQTLRIATMFSCQLNFNFLELIGDILGIPKFYFLVHDSLVNSVSKCKLIGFYSRGFLYGKIRL